MIKTEMSNIKSQNMGTFYYFFTICSIFKSVEGYVLVLISGQIRQTISLFPHCRKKSGYGRCERCCFLFAMLVPCALFNREPWTHFCYQLWALSYQLSAYIRAGFLCLMAGLAPRSHYIKFTIQQPVKTWSSTAGLPRGTPDLPALSTSH